MANRTLWVVEAKWLDVPRHWHTTVGVGLVRTDARRVLRDWQQRNPDDTFRLRRYWAEL